ncbi:uncharacterized protein LOC125666855 [Ostrea edulis]|uniref:uncharacterized protein LOC125666855 n=1 Tax=Ostrea edulis TaxID=37623 RepID=UPI0024AEA373|nr:uncharacterized protein LOC125666855 [Ostrea edulis]
MRNLLIIFILLQGFPVTIYTRRIVMSRYRLNSLSSDAKELRFEPNVSSTLRDVFSLSECALRSRLLSKRAFFYSMEAMECELNPQSHVMYGASGRLDEYILVINKGRKSPENVKACYYKMEKKPYSNYQSAKAICRNKGGYLLEINTKEENDFIKKRFTESIWLGAVAGKSGFTWDNSGKPVQLSELGDITIGDTPSRSNMDKSCLAVTENGWRVTKCSFNPLYVVCEYQTCIH